MQDKVTEGAGIYQRIDRSVARIEGGIAVAVLLSMVLVASLQALFFNIAEQDVAWARAALDGLSWADTFLQKGTLWLAFLGASLATHQDKHIAIDVLPKLSSPKASGVMRLFASFASGVIAFVLAYVFLQACLVADAAVPFDYEVLTPEGPAHVCDGASDAIGEVSKPVAFCALRSFLGALGIAVSSGAGIAQLIAPLMFLMIGFRLLGRSVLTALSLLRGDDPARRAATTDAATSATATSRSDDASLPSEDADDKGSKPDASGFDTPASDNADSKSKDDDESKGDG